MTTALTIPSMGAKVLWTFEDVRAWGNSSNSASFSYNKTLADGTGASQANRIYIYTSTLAPTTALVLDISGGLTDIFGNTITLARVKAMYIELTTDTAAASIAVGGQATLAFANWITSADTLANDQPAVTVRNGGCFFLSAPDATGYVVTASTADLLRIYNNDAAIAATLKIVIIGSSA